MIATVAPRPSSPTRSPSNIGTISSATPPSATPSWIASFTTLTAFNSPEKACENRTPAIKLLTQTQTPEPITLSAKRLLTIARNACSPSREIIAHHQRNAQLVVTPCSIQLDPLHIDDRRTIVHASIGIPDPAYVVFGGGIGHCKIVRNGAHELGSRCSRQRTGDHNRDQAPHRVGGLVKARSGAEILQNPVAPRPSRGSVMQGWREGSAISAGDLATTLPIWLGTSPGVPSPRQPQKMIGPRGSCGVASAPRLAG